MLPAPSPTCSAARRAPDRPCYNPAASRGSMMDLVGILYNPLASPTVELAAEIDYWLGKEGVHTWRGSSQDARTDPAPLTDCSLLICLGSDGTVLRAAHL